MTTRLTRTPIFCAPAACAALVVAPALAGPTIADLAPAESVMVLSVDDFSEARAAFDRTGLAAIWNDPSIREWVESFTDGMSGEFDDALDDLGLDRDAFKAPSGTLGAAFWFTGDEVEAPGMSAMGSGLGMMMLAEYRDQAEAMNALVTRLIEQGEDREIVRAEEDLYDGATIVTLELVQRDEPLEDWEQPDPMSFDRMLYARVGDHLVMTGDRGSMERAIDGLGGANLEVVSGNPDYARAAGMMGEGHAHLVVRTAPLFDMMLAAARMDGGDDTAEMIDAVLQVMGLREVRAAGTNFTLDADAGMVEQRIAVLAPEKRGLLALFDADASPMNAPSFVTADATSYTRMHFRFAGLVPLFNEVLAALPQNDQTAMIQGQAQMVTMMAGPILAQLGPEVHIVEQINRPFAPDSQKYGVAIRVQDTASLTQTIATQFGGMLGEPRDFLGAQIYNPGPDTAIGIGAGHLFTGPTPMVESMLRTALQPAGAPALEDEQRFRRAARVVGQGIAFSYSDFAQSLAYAAWTARNYDQIIEAQFDEMGGEIDDEWREEALRSMRESQPAWLRNLPPTDVIEENIGDTILVTSSTDDGFMMRSITLRPAD